MNSIEFSETDSDGVTKLVRSIRIVPSTKPKTVSLSEHACVWYPIKNRFHPSLLVTMSYVMTEYSKFKGYDVNYVASRTVQPTDEHDGQYLVLERGVYDGPTISYAQISKQENVFSITGVEKKEDSFRLVIKYGV